MMDTQNSFPTFSPTHVEPAMHSGHKPGASSMDMPSDAKAWLAASPRDTRRTRSHSAGRSSATTRSRDLVQDVYDRMGVTRASLDEATTRGRDPTLRSHVSPDKFQERYRAAAELSTRGRSQECRSRRPKSPNRVKETRPDEPATDGQRRARSLSRGRSLKGAWPPTKVQGDSHVEEPLQAIATDWNSPDSPDYGQSPRAFAPKSPMKPSPSVEASHGKNAGPAMTEPVKYSKTKTSPAREDAWRKRAHESSVTSNSKSQDEGGDATISNGSQESKDPRNNPSVRDRISAYSGGAKSARNFPKRYAATGTYAKREFPPKIDIFGGPKPAGDEHGAEDRDEEAVGKAPEPSTVPPSPAAAAAASVAAELVRRNTPSSSSSSPRSAGQGANPVVDTRFMRSGKTKSSHKQTTSAPVSEIESAEQLDAASTTSSMSTDDFVKPPGQRGVVPSGSFPVNRAQLWSERSSKPQGTQKQGPTQFGSARSSTITYSEDDMERFVDARVRSQVSSLETRIQVQMERLEARLEDRMSKKVKSMEEKLNEMSEMLVMLVENLASKQAEI